MNVKTVRVAVKSGVTAHCNRYWRGHCLDFAAFTLLEVFVLVIAFAVIPLLGGARVYVVGTALCGTLICGIVLSLPQGFLARVRAQRNRRGR